MRAKRVDKNGSHGQKNCAATGGERYLFVWAHYNKNRRSHPLGDSETHNDRLEKLERSNTVHGLLCGEGVSLTLGGRGQRDAVSIR